MLQLTWYLNIGHFPNSKKLCVFLKFGLGTPRNIKEKNGG